MFTALAGTIYRLAIVSSATALLTSSIQDGRITHFLYLVLSTLNTHLSN